jgi:hypothetical protein
VSKLPQSPRNGISETLNLKISSGLRPSFSPPPLPNQKELPTALLASVIYLWVKYAYFICKLRLHFPDSKHLLGFVCHEIFGNFFRHSEIFGLHPPTIHASYGPVYTVKCSAITSCSAFCFEQLWVYLSTDDSKNGLLLLT